MPKGFRRDYWQIDHLAGGPLREALGLANKAAQTEFARCIHEDKGRKQARMSQSAARSRDEPISCEIPCAGSLARPQHTRRLPAGHCTSAACLPHACCMPAARVALISDWGRAVQACFRTRLVQFNATLLPWEGLLAELGVAQGPLDFLVIDVGAYSDVSLAAGRSEHTAHLCRSTLPMQIPLPLLFLVFAP